MNIRVASLLGLLTSMPALSVQAQPVVPGMIVEEYAAVPGVMAISFDHSTGTLYCGRDGPGCDALRIHRVGPDGSPVEEYGDPIRDPDAVLFDATGRIAGLPDSVLVGGAVSPCTPTMWVIGTDQTTTSVCGSGLNNLVDFAFDSVGRMVFADENGTNGRALVSSGECPAAVLVPSIPGRTGTLAVDVNGWLETDAFFTGSGNGTIRLFASDGTLIDNAFASAPGFMPPIAVSPGGPIWGDFLYAIRKNTGELLRIDSAKNVSIVGSGFTGDARDMEFGPDGALYVSMLAENRVLRIRPATCVDGTVNLGAGVITDVLFVNGSAGNRVGEIATGIAKPVEVLLAAAPGGPDPARYCVWVWSGVPVNPTALMARGSTLGCTVTPTPFDPDGLPRPVRCLSGGMPPLVCRGVRTFSDAPPRAPWVLRRNRGFSRPLVFAIQGVVEDAVAGNPSGISVTNAVILRIE